MWPWADLVLWVIIIGLSVLVLALMRQVGDLQLAVQPGGLGRLPGTSAPDFTATTIFGEQITLSAFAAQQVATILVFGHTGCAACKSLASALAGDLHPESGFPVLFINTSNEEQNRALAEAHGLSRVITDADRRITRDYSVNATPLAFVVDRTATVRAKGVVNDDGDITHLLQLSGFAVDKEKGSKPSPARRGFSLAGLLGR